MHSSRLAWMSASDGTWRPQLMAMMPRLAMPERLFVWVSVGAQVVVWFASICGYEPGTMKPRATTKATIYHNPRCSKSRQALALLTERGVETDVVEYLKQPPSVAEVRRLIDQLGLPPHAIVRTKEAAYAAHALHPDSTKEQVAKAIAADPLLLERPIVVVGDRAVLGRPPENVLQLV